jgi:hypothetical protein
MSEGFNLRRFLLIFLLIAASLTVHYRDLYFGPPLYEVGDYAANALQITHAKSFDELYGNYSRWGFNHPGPAFFYCYAFAESVFYDLVPLFHSPQQAHEFANLLLQSFFLALALAAFSQFARSLLFAGLIVLFAVAHFHYAPNSLLVDIWPPHVLIGPMLSLIACAAAVSCGHKSYLPLMVLSAGFLTHGHVAQPLFVVPIITLSLIMYLKHRRGDLQRLPDKNSWIASGLLILLFATPIILDIIKGSESNFALIIGHLKTHEGRTKSLARSIGYFIGFLLYKVKAGSDIIAPYDFSLVRFVNQNLQIILLWAIVIVLPFASLFRNKHTWNITASGRRYFQRLALCNCIAFALTIQWGRMQDGQMFAYNAYFNYAIILAAVVPFMLFISKTIEEKLPYLVRALQVCISIAVIILILIPASPTDSQLESNPLIPKLVKSALESSGRRPVLLNVGHWITATGVALALQREGVPFLVSKDHGCMFGRRYVAQGLNVQENQNISIWGVGFNGIVIQR